MDWIFIKKKCCPWSVNSDLRRVRTNREKRLLRIFVIYVRPSVCPCVSALLPLDGFSWNTILVTLRICWETPYLLYRTNTTPTVSEKLGIFYYRQQKENTAKKTYWLISTADLNNFIRSTFLVDKKQYEMEIILPVIVNSGYLNAP
jgi:hypothetical protein